jgi:CheY-like chemotaxis protein
VRLEVEDDGCGIEPAVLPRIFDPFFTTKPRERGTGLGLSVVLGIVRNHQGAVRAKSVPGRGTTFTLHFPVALDPATAPVFPAAENPPPGRGQTLLLVDDERAIALAMARALTRLNYNPVVFTSSLEALSAFRDQPDLYRLLITDFTMPEMNGEELIAALRKISPHLPVILCSGALDARIESRLGPMRVSTFLAKPYTPAQLGQAVRHALQTAPGRQA